jgi:heterodisulfide reductase subunit B
MSYTFFPGCLIRSRLPHLEKSARVVLERLGVNLTDLAGATCCPNPIYFRDLDREAWLTLAARNLSLFKDDGKPMMTLCSGCYSTFREAGHALGADKTLRERVGQCLKDIGREYVPGLDVEHFARFLYEKIGPERLKEVTNRPLKGLKVAFHHGCHFVRPSRLHEFDDPDNPTKLEELIRAVGAEVLDYPRKMLCCGITVMAVDRNLSLQMGFEKLKLMKDFGADAVVLPCPSCMVQFDRNQRLIEKEFDTELSLPVFFLTELLGLALGESPESLGLDLHLVNTLPLANVLAGIDEKEATDSVGDQK